MLFYILQSYTWCRNVLWDPTSVGEGNGAFIVRVWKPLPCKRVLKSWDWRLYRTSRSGQYLLAVCLGCYMRYLINQAYWIKSNDIISLFNLWNQFSFALFLQISYGTSVASLLSFLDNSSIPVWLPYHSISKCIFSANCFGENLT